MSGFGTLFSSRNIFGSFSSMCGECVLNGQLGIVICLSVVFVSSPRFFSILFSTGIVYLELPSCNMGLEDGLQGRTAAT